MLAKLQDLIVRVSRTWWLYLIVVLLMFGTLRSLMLIGEVFPAHAAGAEPFDLQNGLTAAQVYPQLAGYTDRARELYYAFTAIDYLFPFTAGLFIAGTAAFALRHGLPRWYEALVSRRLLPVFMLGSAFDWLENVSIITTMGFYPTEIGALPLLIVAAKKAKLAMVVVSQGAMALLLLAALARWLRDRFSPAAGTPRT